MLKNNLWLILILGLGIMLRVWQLGQFPPSLNWDEVSLGYNAYSLLKTGRDEWGQILPTIFRAYGDYKLPVYVYLAVPLQAILGQTEVSVRLVSVLAGILTILIMYRLGGKWAGLTTAIMPWSWFLSRIALEANLVVLFLSLGLYCLLTQKYSRAILLFGISVWTYNSARIFVPLFLISYWLFNFRKIKLSISMIIIGLIFFMPMFWQLLNPVGQARYQALNILDEGAISHINSLRSQPGGRLLYNKATYFGYIFFKNYLTYLSPNFLFLKGGTHYQFSIPGTGLLYVSLLPCVILGFYKGRKNFWLWLWLLLAPIAGSITRDSPHALRAIVLLPIMPLIASKGINRLVNKKKFFAILILILLSIETINYGLKFKTYTQTYSWAWQYGHSQVVQFIKEHYSDYDQIIFTKRYGEPHEFVAYYWSWDPSKFSSEKLWDYHANWYWINGLDKFMFVNDWEIKDQISNLSQNKHTLVIYSPENEGIGKEVFRVNFLDNKPAFIAKEL